jgi:hypothetical protein
MIDNIRCLYAAESLKIPLEMVGFGRQMAAAAFNWTLFWRSKPRFLGGDPMLAAAYFEKGKCALRRTKPGMQWVERVSNRRFQAILARNIFVESWQ